MIALAIVLGCSIVPVIIARRFGPRKSWEPFRATTMFVGAYVVAVGVLMYVDILILDMCDGKWAQVKWNAFWSFYWPIWVAFCAPSVAMTILGVHLWPNRRPGMLYALALFPIIGGVQALASTELRLPTMIAIQVMAGCAWMLGVWLLARRVRAPAV